MQVYQIIFQDEYNNLYELGYYTDLAKGVEELNKDHLSLYNISIKLEDLEERRLRNHHSLDLCLGDIVDCDNECFDEICDCFVRCFVKDLDIEIEYLNRLKKGEQNGEN